MYLLMMVLHLSVVVALQALATVASFSAPHDMFVSTWRPMPIGFASRKASQHTRRRRTCTSVSFSQPSANDQEEKIELTPQTIAEMIEVSFIQSCLQLAQGYIDVLKLFIVAVKAGYELSLPLSELHQLVVECPVNSANRELMAEEKELRYEWMVVVYDMLNALNPDSKVDTSGEGDNISRVSSGRISQVIEAMLDIHTELQNEEATSGGKQDATVALANLTVQQAMERSPKLSKLNESTTDPTQKALLTNDIRVALMTFRVLEEEKICMQDTAGGMKSGSVPRPPIPGT